VKPRGEPLGKEEMRMNKQLFKRLISKRILTVMILSIMSFSLMSYYVKEAEAIGPIDNHFDDLVEFDGTYDWEKPLSDPGSSSSYLSYTDLRNTYCKYTSTLEAWTEAVYGADGVGGDNDKIIRFDTAEELYRFSLDVSYDQIYLSGDPNENYKLPPDKINFLLGLDYVLGNNIDYSVVGSKRFIPIGYSFYDASDIIHENLFDGSFDGQGFHISNLYLADYDKLVHEEEKDDSIIDVANSPYYSMFSINKGVIKNLGLINPTLELLMLHFNINKVANLVGENQGTVDHVYVIDNRESVMEAGIRYNVGTSSASFHAAGMIHTNSGNFSNSYYVSKVVVNGAYVNKIAAQPVLYTNTGSIANLVYDSDRYLLQVQVGVQSFPIATPNAYATGEATATLKSTSSVLNQETNHWYFYPSDVYPLAEGLDYDAENEVYYIETAVDLVFFSKLIGFQSVANGNAYAYSDYVLGNNIDMGVLAPGAYLTPGVTFYGSLSGLNPEGEDLSDNFYIHNLVINKGTLRGNIYYAGLFSILGANSSVNNLNIFNSEITLTDTESYYSSTFYIGMVSGRLTAGSITDVLLDIDIDLGNDAIGETHVGSLVGLASGTIERIASSGSIDAGDHVFQSEYNIKPYYYIGGIIGSATTLKLSVDDVVNHGDIYGFGTASSFSLATGATMIDVKIGGVIGYIYNQTSSIHEFTNITNTGDIYLDDVIYSASSPTLPSRQRVGGIFGELTGLAPIIEANAEYAFANFYNSGSVHSACSQNTAPIRAAGIGTTNTTEAVEYALMFNHGNFDYDTTGATAASQHFHFTATISDVGGSDITLSRVYNYADFIYDNACYADVSPFYHSVNDNDTLIRYSTNYGSISFLSNSGDSTITMTTHMYLAGITTSANVSMQNVINEGDITVVNVNVATYTMSVAGLMTNVNSGKAIKNSINKGKITVAYINSSTSGYPNIYIGGLVNGNYSGDLHNPGQSPTQPRATTGIINSINYGEITTSYSSSRLGIRNRSNTFMGGIATMNSGSIQDSANLGDLRAYNSSTSATLTFSSGSYTANRVSDYTHGVTVGGIVAITLTGDARVYDTANRGDIVALGYRYVRAGGIIAVSLYAEAYAGGISSETHGLTTSVSDSVLLNGMNFGNVSAISNNVGSYSTTSYNTSISTLRYGPGTVLGGTTGISVYPNTTVGSNDRPGVYAASGGVVGYGLSTMKNMLNHGTISGTDVAGGIVGATYVEGDANTLTTVVDINTAINYGDIKAISVSSYSSIDKYELSFDDVSDYFLPDGNTTIFPSSYGTDFPSTKRGFGGIFGRLQRGVRGIMSTEGGSFNFIVNANPNIDLVGRLDQDYAFTNSARYFQFYDAIYYSARFNDTTQMVFTGFYYYYLRITNRTSSWGVYTYTATIVSIYKQVGVESELVSSPNTPGYVFTSSQRLNTNSYTYRYNTGIEVNWITENPSDPNITDIDNEYIYDPDFPMRTNPILQKYIYYMENNLLAPQFTSVRPYGMYVLSTTAGSTYGSVLPANINTGLMKPINEDYPGDISLLLDYDTVSPLYLSDFSADFVSRYDLLRQTVFNDKAELIPSDSVDVVLKEVGGSSTVLSAVDIDYINKTLTFTISMEAFLAGQTTASYEVASAFTSACALIAIRAYDYYGHSPSQAEIEAFRALLNSAGESGISLDYPADLEVTLPAKTITSEVTLSLGYFTVYSEAFVKNNLFAHPQYYNDYHVYITFTPGIEHSSGSTALTGANLNGGGLIDISSSPTDIRSFGDVESSGSLRLVFTDTNGVFTEGYDFKNSFVLKYSDHTTVASDYYIVSSEPTVIDAGTGTYAVTFTFLGNIIKGDYYFEYRFFPSSAVNTIYFDKAASTAKAILDFSHYSILQSKLINGQAISSNINLGYVLNIDTSTNNFTENVDGSLPSYRSKKTYDISFMTAGSFKISPFAEITRAQLISTTYTNGYKDYTIEYVVKAEDSSTVTYTHHVYEREIDFVSALLNGNETNPEDLYVNREDSLTTFTLDLGLDQALDLYNLTEGSESYFTIDVSATDLQETPYDPDDIVGITYDVDDLLNIYIGFDTLPGYYTFQFYFYRDGTANYVTLATTVEIVKAEGVSAYLTDIRFSQWAFETSYPDMYTANSQGVVNTDYYPAVYFAGIDYAGADTAGYQYFKVAGKVSKVPLEQYAPFMLDYLPYGATIARYAYDYAEGEWYWTNEVAYGASYEEESVLLANFTVFPDTGLEPGENEEVMILYRVTAENGENMVYYFITVTDVEFNATFIFDIYYCTGDPEICELASAEDSGFNDKTVVITVKNYQMLLEGEPANDTVVNVTNPENYPDFDEIDHMISITTQMYYTHPAEYYYSFARNRSGFFVFNIDLPVDRYFHDLYEFEIIFNEYTLYDASDYIEGLKGKYFYIGPSTKNRSRRFNVYIRELDSVDTDKPWGLFDFFRSWGDND
jgi:hypothetical protein